ncbi:MAG: formyltransferase family protein [Pseudomonadota bacterium]
MQVRKKIKVAILTPENSIKGAVVAEYLKTIKLGECEQIDFVVWTMQNSFSRSIADLGFDFRIVKSYNLDEEKDIEALKKVDFLVVCGWGKLISASAVSAPKLASLNCHSSYLPDYKGGSVYKYQWANIERYGGATVHFLTEHFDSGNILAQQKFRIKGCDAPKDILYRASEFTGPLIVQAIFLVLQGQVGTPQVGGRYFKKLPMRKLIIHRLYNKTIGSLIGSRLVTPFTDVKK